MWEILHMRKLQRSACTPRSAHRKETERQHKDMRRQIISPLQGTQAVNQYSKCYHNRLLTFLALVQGSPCFKQDSGFHGD